MNARVSGPSFAAPSRGASAWMPAVMAALAALPVRGQDFFQTFDSMTGVNADFTVSTWSNDNRAHAAANVAVRDGALELKLSGSNPGAIPVCAEIVSRRSDFHYGTYRASVKVTHVPGAVGGFFTYLGNPLNEIDIEFLSRNLRTAYFTLHHVQTGVDHDTRTLAFDPSAGFHEYRFDWYANRVEYYVDGQIQATLTKQVPDMPSRLLLNHWSGNIPGWGGAAPTTDAFMQVDWVFYSPEYRSPPLPLLRPLGPRKSPGMALLPIGGQVLLLRDGKLHSLEGRVLEITAQ